jgi:Lar family restriction alleviation protein
MTEAELNPCPFCGGEDIKIRFSWIIWSYCGYCETCKSEGPMELSKKESIQSWNRRA